MKSKEKEYRELYLSILAITDMLFITTILLIMVMINPLLFYGGLIGVEAFGLYVFIRLCFYSNKHRKKCKEVKVENGNKL